MEIAYFIILLFVAIVSYIDLKTYNVKGKGIPSSLTTLPICFSFLVTLNPFTIIYSFLLGMLLVDLDFFKGVPDWKMVVACGAILPDILTITFFGLFVVITGLSYKIIASRRKMKEIPFLPAIGIGYVFTIIMVVLI